MPGGLSGSQRRSSRIAADPENGHCRYDLGSAFVLGLGDLMPEAVSDATRQYERIQRLLTEEQKPQSLVHTRGFFSGIKFVDAF